MAKIKSSGNISTELLFIKLLKLNAIKGWRRNYKIIGKPDIVFAKQKVAIFLDGCFWHGHHCRNLTPKTNTEYWQKKISRNIARDKFVTKELKNRGWIVIRLWECNIKTFRVSKLITLLK